jgi:hypothetical protein
LGAADGGDGGFVLGTAKGGAVAATGGVAGGTAGRAGTDGGAAAAGADVAAAGFCVEAGGTGGFAIAWDGTGGVTGVTVSRAIALAGAASAGFVGAAGASSRMTTDKPTNPMATAAPPYKSMVLSAGVPREAGRG